MVIQLGLGANIPYYLSYGLKKMNINSCLIMPKKMMTVTEIFYGYGSGNPLGVNIKYTKYHYLRFFDSLFEAALLSDKLPVIVHTHVGREFRTRIPASMLSRMSRMFGKKLYVVWHFHGSDIRSMTKIAKLVFTMFPSDAHLVSTPDMLLHAKRWHIGAEWLPNPVDPLITSNLIFTEDKMRHYILESIATIKSYKLKGKKIFFIPTRQDPIKGIMDFLSIIKDDSYSLNILKNNSIFAVIAWGSYSNDFIHELKKIGLKTIIFPILNRYEYIKLLRLSDVVIGQFKLGIPGLTELEALAAGKIVVMGEVSRQIYQSYNTAPPIFTLTSDDLSNLIELVFSDETILKVSQAGKRFIKEFHEINTVTGRLLKIYNATINQGSM